MAQPQESRRLYNALINSENIVYTVLPDGAASVTLTAAAGAWTWSANWAQIAASVGAADAWFIGVAIENPSNPAVSYDVGIGFGTAPLGTSIASLPYFAPIVFVPFPVRILATLGVVGRLRSTNAVANTVAVKVLMMAGA